MFPPNLTNTPKTTMIEHPQSPYIFYLQWPGLWTIQQDRKHCRWEYPNLLDNLASFCTLEVQNAFQTLQQAYPNHTINPEKLPGSLLSNTTSSAYSKSETVPPGRNSTPEWGHNEKVDSGSESMTKLKREGGIGQPWRTPLFVVNSGDKLS